MHSTTPSRICSRFLLLVFLAPATLLPACVTSLVRSIQEGDSTSFRSLVDQGGEIETPYQDKTPLLWAVHEGNVSMVAYLLDHGADMEKTEAEGRTPLLLATRAGNVEIAKLLLDRGARVNTQDNDGNTPLIMAAGAETLQTVKLLAEKGADLDKADRRGNTPLAMAAGAGHLEMTKYLIEKGANTRTLDEDGMTLLLTALKYNNPQVAKFLVEGDHCDVNAAERGGKTALHFAAKMSNTSSPKGDELVGLLLKHGANPGAKRD